MLSYKACSSKHIIQKTNQQICLIATGKKKLNLILVTYTTYFPVSENYESYNHMSEIQSSDVVTVMKKKFTPQGSTYADGVLSNPSDQRKIS